MRRRTAGEVVRRDEHLLFLREHIEVAGQCAVGGFPRLAIEGLGTTLEPQWCFAPIPSGWQIGDARIRFLYERRATKPHSASDGPMVGKPRTATSQKATARTAADAGPATPRLSVVLGVLREMPASRADGIRSVGHPLGT